MDLFYGQIRPSNFDALYLVYGYDPPWPMKCSPQADLVDALVTGRSPEHTAFAEYLRLTNRSELLEERVRVLRGLMESRGPLTANTCCGSVLDGNHRTAVALVQHRELECTESFPYQTINTPQMFYAGRRLDDRFPLDYDLTGKRVLDLGARDGMNAVHALEAGAARVVLLECDCTSLLWQVIDDCGARDRVVVKVADANDCLNIDCDVVLAFSVVQHIGAACLSHYIQGRTCLLETHTEVEQPPATGHRWRLLKTTVYSRSNPHEKRSLYLGEP